jgi:hypothetical protein
MTEFLSSYGIWIVLGLLFLFMFRRGGHGGGGCCGGGGSHQHDQETPEKENGRQTNSGRSSAGCH